MKTIAAGKFKATCLNILDDVQSRREAVIITKHGRAVARLMPVDEGDEQFYGFFCGRGEITSEVVSPALSAREWGDLR